METKLLIQKVLGVLSTSPRPQPNSQNCNANGTTTPNSAPPPNIPSSMTPAAFGHQTPPPPPSPSPTNNNGSPPLSHNNNNNNLNNIPTNHFGMTSLPLPIIPTPFLESAGFPGTSSSSTNSVPMSSPPLATSSPNTLTAPTSPALSTAGTFGSLEPADHLLEDIEDDDDEVPINSLKGIIRPIATGVINHKDEYLVEGVINAQGVLEPKVLGEGGFGTVYAANRLRDGAPIAVKVIKKSKVPAWEMLGPHRVPHEILLLMRVAHIPSVVKLLAWDEDKTSFRLFLERPDPCKDLWLYISMRGRLPEAEARDFMLQVVRMLQACHDAGVIHRDVKDENILVTKDKSGRKVLKLIDFGAGTLYRDHICKKFDGGTKQYAPPEWVMTNTYHAIAGTTWSLGILLYDMVVGDIPFENESQIKAAKIAFPVPLSGHCQHLIQWCLKFRPCDRPNLQQILMHPWLGVHQQLKDVPPSFYFPRTLPASTSNHSKANSPVGSFGSAGSSYNSESSPQTQRSMERLEFSSASSRDSRNSRS